MWKPSNTEILLSQVAPLLRFFLPSISTHVPTPPPPLRTRIVWDCSGAQMIRPLWIHYYKGSDAIIFVVDSSDRERIDGPYESAKDTLKNVLSSKELDGKPLLVLANKQDLFKVMKVNEIAGKLGLREMAHSG